jgi:L-lactate dehydrogenase (cytochrome)/(S)-mandelate dehydrogenase
MTDPIKSAQSIQDLRRLARKRLPRVMFEVIESGVEDENALLWNERAFRQFRLMPRYLGDIETRDQCVNLLGRACQSPFGIGPTGFAAVLRPDADRFLGSVAKAAGIPFILSGAAATAIEQVAEVTGDRLWYHLYPAKEASITADIVGRVRDAGIHTLVLTVDNPVFPKRERDIRNGFTLPLRPSLKMLVDGLTHPAWTLSYFLNGGMPRMDTWARYVPSGASPGEIGAFFRSQSPSIQTWKDLERLRSQWPGHLILKGIQHPEDAIRAVSVGVDGIIVSNHGGKSFDLLPSPIDTLPAVRQAVHPQIPVMLDSGVRRGADIAIALCRGADFVFVGRSTLYGVAAGGRPGAERAVQILRDEFDMTLAMIGCTRVKDLSADHLLSPSQADTWAVDPQRAFQRL